MKKVLIVNLCFDDLHYFEFVSPIVDIVEKEGHEVIVCKFNEIKKFYENADYIIACGTALKDFNYQKLKIKISDKINFDKPILGICAGAHLLGLFLGSELVENKKIGIFKNLIVYNDPILKSLNYEFDCYCLYSFFPEISEVCVALGRSKEGHPLIFKHSILPHYGCLFHPEVKNPEIIKNFLNL